MIIVAGVIGAGKSTFTEELAKDLGTRAFYEPVGDNPVLPLYYEDPKQYGFLLQIFFLNRRFNMIKQAYQENNNVLDRSIYEDLLFTKINFENGNMTQAELDVYSDLLDNMMEEIKGMPKKAPDIMVYLDVDFETMLSRIVKRGRPYEQFTHGDDLEQYYRKVWEKYQTWYDEYDVSPKIKINVQEHDLVSEEGLAFALEQTKDALREQGLL